MQSTTVRAKNRARPEAVTSGRNATGPGITLEVLDGPMDGLTLSGDFEHIKIGRNPGNDLELHSDRSVSSDHAVLRRTDEDNGWHVEDLRSTNGTWIDGRRLNAGEPAAVDDVFMAGHTVLRVAAGAETESFLPDAQSLRDEMARLTAGFAPATAAGYGAAVALAGGELKPFLSDRHFFLGLMAMNPDLAIFARNQGPIPPRFLTETLRRNEYWRGPQAWINRQLRALAIEVTSLFKDDLVPTPRLLRLLLAAAETARTAGSDVIRPEDMLHAFFAGPSNRPLELLIRDGIDPESLLKLLGKGGAKRPVAEVTKPHAALIVAPLVSTGEPVLDARAQEVARGLYGVAALYQLAAAEDRHDAMRQFLVQEIAQVSGDGRTRLLRQVQRLFPVATAAVADLTMASAPERTGKRKKVTVLESPLPSLAGVVPWRAVMESKGRDEALAGLGAEERAAAELFADLYTFSTALERFIVSIVQNLRSPGVGTETLQLPGARTSILRHSRDLLAGKAPRHEALKEYLTAVETWLVATVAAYHEGPDLWFKDFWRKVSPAAIESPLAEENKKKRLSFGIDSLEFWNRYKERVRTVSPDLISDEILHIVRRRVEEQYNQLCERRKP